MAIGAGAVLMAVGTVTLVVRALLRELRQNSLENRVCLVAGDLLGPELVLARHLLWRGARVALCGIDSPDLGSVESARMVLGERRDVMVVTCDPRDRAAVELMVDAVAAGLGAIEVVIGAGGPGLIAECAGARLLLTPALRADPDLERSARRMVDAIEVGRETAAPEGGFRRRRPRL